ncbi:hypothetical protein M514_03681 [Trichuris suis]|uniref:Uncharacterized protein n=1 Tax=Trichuris suis TaxID=68888 RepID=A0A085MDP5_9BILA|nr:hypothetical protein M513_03681 [Trichuris suis]KFD68659.1 hypothetical protein M514_03681 [Trichuris suis]
MVKGLELENVRQRLRASAGYAAPSKKPLVFQFPSTLKEVILIIENAAFTDQEQQSNVEKSMHFCPELNVAELLLHIILSSINPCLVNATTIRLT